jgi:coenzyme F420-reducing hydrogenase beta subunit
MINKIPKGTTNISAYYSVRDVYDLQQLGIDIEQVDSFLIRHLKLEITYKDGTKAEYDTTSEYDTDYTTPHEIEFDED